MHFIHTADIHLGKTYRNSPGEAKRYEDFFRCLLGIVNDAISETVDFVLICGDLFHTGQILPRTFAKTIETLQPIKEIFIALCFPGGVAVCFAEVDVSGVNETNIHIFSMMFLVIQLTI